MIFPNDSPHQRCLETLTNILKYDKKEKEYTKLLSKYFCTFLHSFKSEHCAHTMFSCALGLIRHHLS